VNTQVHITWPTGPEGDALADAIVEGLTVRGASFDLAADARRFRATVEVAGADHAALNGAAVSLIREVEEAGAEVGNWSVLQFLVKPVRLV
jgi:hypothetical protein